MHIFKTTEEALIYTQIPIRITHKMTFFLLYHKQTSKSLKISKLTRFSKIKHGLTLIFFNLKIRKTLT